MRPALRLTGAALGIALLPLPFLAAGPAAAEPSIATYEVTIINRALGQPLSPPVLATHDETVDLFERGRRASRGVAAIAQAGDQSLAVSRLTSRVGDGVTDVAEGAPERALLGVAGPQTTQTVTIEAVPGDRLSIASMLICTNDGFTGLDSKPLPESGTVAYPLFAYDAGVERNTQRSEHIVDPCSLLGPVALDGDDNGNVDTGRVLTSPAQPIGMHRGVGHWGDLQQVHDWSGPVAVVQVTRTS